mmetsp:Transcript_3737/g.6751  ORF Transcript_3737/g.6751 Transcript_3737/m.6751 type:complete len:219 (-) Transcript_3737:12-668(-)
MTCCRSHRKTSAVSAPVKPGLAIGCDRGGIGTLASTASFLDSCVRVEISTSGTAAWASPFMGRDFATRSSATSIRNVECCPWQALGGSTRTAHISSSRLLHALGWMESTWSSAMLSKAWRSLMKSRLAEQRAATRRRACGSTVAARRRPSFSESRHLTPPPRRIRQSMRAQRCVHSRRPAVRWKGQSCWTTSAKCRLCQTRCGRKHGPIATTCSKRWR